MRDIETLDSAQVKAIQALLTTSSRRKAAQKADVSEATLFRWLREPCFRSAYSSAKQDLYDQAMGNIQRALSLAVKTLREVMKDELAKPADRVAAAKAVLKTGAAYNQEGEHDERIAALEESISSLRQALENNSRPAKVSPFRSTPRSA